jgi:hypothetical protein
VVIPAVGDWVRVKDYPLPEGAVNIWLVDAIIDREVPELRLDHIEGLPSIVIAANQCRYQVW